MLRRVSEWTPAVRALDLRSIQTGKAYAELIFQNPDTTKIQRQYNNIKDMTIAQLQVEYKARDPNNKGLSGKNK